MNAPVMATALIADDEPLLSAHLQRELMRLWPELDVIAVAPNGQAAIELGLKLLPDILFLDVRMPGRTGLEAAQEMIEDWPEGTPLPLIAFVTAYDAYAVKAFDLAAADYLLKPLRADRLEECCDRLRAKLWSRQAPTVGSESAERALDQLRQLVAQCGVTGLPSSTPLKVIQAAVGSSVYLVPVDTICYVEAADKYVRVLTATKEFLLRSSLKELLPQLDPNTFWQVHRGTIVRIDAVVRAQRDDTGKLSLELRDRKERLSVSRLYSHRFKGM